VVRLDGFVAHCYCFNALGKIGLEVLMSKTFRIAVAQLDFLVGDIKGNTQIILDSLEKAKQTSVDLMIFPELALSGYPPEDLLLREDFKKQIKVGVKTYSRKIH